MKKLILISALAVMTWSCKAKQDMTATETTTTTAVQSPEAFAQTITEAELKEMLYVYASDEFEGRNTGEAGHDKAVNYLKSFYETAGIASAVSDGSYTQKVPLNKIFTPEVEAVVNGESLQAFDDIVSLAPSLNGSLNANEIVYIGYGVDDDNYSDYTNVDVKGKIVLAKAGEPQNVDGTYKVSGTSEASRWSNGRRGRSFKKDAAEKHGAAAFLIVDNAAFAFYSNAYRQRYNNNASLGMSISSNETPMHYYMLSETTA